MSTSRAMARRPRLAFLVALVASQLACIALHITSAAAVEPKPKHLFKGDLNSTAALKKYYGKTEWRDSSEFEGKPHQILVCGYHNTGTSIVIRLLMLMGVWAGELTDIWLSPTNALKYFEKREVLRLEDASLGPYAAAEWRDIKIARWLGAGVDVNAMSEGDLARFKKRIAEVEASMNSHSPWGIKNPRLCLSSPVWTSVLQHPLCIIVYKNPREVSYRLSLHSIKSFQNLNKGSKVRTAPLHLEAWRNYTLGGLRGCSGKPTVIFPATLLASRATTEMALAVLYEELQRAGVPDLQLPSYALLNREVLQWLMSRQEGDDMRFDSGHKNSTIVFDSSLLATNLLWTPDRPDAPWMEPTEEAWDVGKAALSQALQQYLREAFVEGSRVPAADVAARVLEIYEEKLKE